MSHSTPLKGKTAIVTGASSGIGEALVEELAANGCNVVLAARNTERIEASAAAINQRGGGLAIAVETDVVDSEACRRMVDKTIEVFGGIDILICNAGISMRALLDDTDLSVLHRLMEVNFWGCVNCTKYALPYLQQSKGSIVGISSVAGLHGLPARSGYSASKYAMTGFLETVRIENLKRGLHVMIVCPGFTATDIRRRALTCDGTPQGQTPRHEEAMDSPQSVAQEVVRQILRRKRLLLLDFNGRATHLLKKFAPKLLDRLFYAAMAKEPDSPLK